MIPEGALKGVQFMRTPDYVQVVGFVDQTKINIKKGDGGGEMDPHGADLVCAFTFILCIYCIDIALSEGTRLEVWCTRRPGAVTTIPMIRFMNGTSMTPSLPLVALLRLWIQLHG